MAYFIEFGLDHGEGLYAEIVIINHNTGFVLPGDGIDHRFYVHREGRDYGRWHDYGELIASNANGLITAPEPGVVAISIPPHVLDHRTGGDGYGWGSYYGRGRREDTMRCRLLAVPEDTNFTKTLFTGTISFGDHLMSCPRIKLGVYPLYPNSATAVPIAPEVEMSQVQQQLVSLGALDQIEGALTSGPTDAAAIQWRVGGPVKQGGPIANVIAATLGFDPTAMALFLFACSQRPI